MAYLRLEHWGVHLHGLDMRDMKYERIWFVHTIYIYFRYGCKLNSLVLEDSFIQKVYTGRWSRHKPQVYIVVICNWIIELALQVINASDYTHTASSTGNENVYVVNGARLLNGGLQEFRVCYVRTLQSKEELKIETYFYKD